LSGLGGGFAIVAFRALLPIGDCPYAD
jgi:hypothetical protein